MSRAELVAVFAVDVNCQVLRKDTEIPQYVLFVLSMPCLAVPSCENIYMAAMIFRESCVSEVSSKCVNRDEHPYAPIEYNIRASQIMDYTSFVLMCTYNICNWEKRERGKVFNVASSL